MAPDFKVAVNISAVQLISDGLVDAVQAELATAGLDGSCLELEITETAAMRDPERTVAQLVALRGLGISIAIDDFGTGSSSLSYLKQFPLSCLKLDRSFVQDIDTDPGDETICRATVLLAHALSLSVVAEGVETDRQLELLGELQCDVVQGYLVGLPSDAAGITEALRSQRPVVQSYRCGTP